MVPQDTEFAPPELKENDVPAELQTWKPAEIALDAPGGARALVVMEYPTGIRLEAQ
jgi:hypothetical protein